MMKEKILLAAMLGALFTAWITNTPIAEAKEWLLLAALAYVCWKVGNLETRLLQLEEDAQRRQAA